MGCNAWNHAPGCDCGWGGDTGGGGEWICGPGDRKPIHPPSPFGYWRHHEARRLQSYTIPNARCPVCGDPVFFYQSEFGGRVFFDPPLGPPWPKHPCTDNRPDIQERIRQSSETFFGTRKSSPIVVQRSDDWHPLLSIRVRRTGKWFAVHGFDPVDNHHCEILTQVDLDELAPTFVRVKEPQRLACEIDQVRGLRSAPIEIVKGAGWYGVSDLDSAKVAKNAKQGDIKALRDHAAFVSYRHIGSDNWISDVAQFLDLRCAVHLFEKAGRLGSTEAIIEHAYLLDLIDIDEARSRWRRQNPDVSLRLAPKAFQSAMSGRRAHAICVRIEQLDMFAELRREAASDWAENYYTRQMKPGRDYLERISLEPDHPRLSKAIAAFLETLTR